MVGAKYLKLPLLGRIVAVTQIVWFFLNFLVLIRKKSLVTFAGNWRYSFDRVHLAFG